MSLQAILALGLALGVSLSACGAPSRRPSAAVSAAPSASASAASARCDDVPTCEQDCLRGALASCTRASSLMSDHPLTASLERLMAVQERACELGRGRSCVELAAHFVSAPRVARDEARARALRERACSLGDGVGCFSLIEDVEAIDHPAKASERDRTTLARAEAALRSNCDDHDGRGCLILSVLLMGKGARDQGASMVLRAGREFEKSCLDGVADDCVGWALQFGVRTEDTRKRGRWMIEHGCDLGSMRACAELAQDARSGRSAEDVSKLRRACEVDHEMSCLRLAYMIGRREVPLAEPHEAKVLLDRSLALGRVRCERADPGGCAFLSLLLGSGALQGETAREALALIEGACERGEKEACAKLGEALSSDSLPVALLDPERGARLRKKACEDGYSPACPDLAVALKLYPRLEVPVIDRRARLVWEPVAEAPETLDTARRACSPPQRLPTRADLATLVGPDGSLRRFARVTLPARGQLLSGELADGGQPWVLDVIDGQLVRSDLRAGHRRCVSDLPAKLSPANATVRLELYGESMSYVLVPTAGRPRAEVTLASESIPEPIALVGLDARLGAVDIEVDESSPFGPVTRFVRAASQAGVTVRRVTLVRASR